MRNELFNQKELRTENGTSISLNYNLISIDMKNEADGIKTAYGVGIEKYVNSICSEKDYVPAISDEKGKVLDILKVLCNCAVTPMYLATVLDELMM